MPLIHKICVILICAVNLSAAGYLAFKAHPTDQDRIARSLFWEKLQMPDKAVEEIKALQKPGSFGADPYVRLGVILYHSSDLAGAAKNFKTALRLDPQNQEALFYLGKIAFDRKRSEKAKDYFQKLIGINPHHSGALLGLGDITFAESRLQEAEDYYERAYQENAVDMETQLKLGEIKLKLNKISEAEKALETGLALNPHEMAFYSKLILVYKATGDKPKLYQTLLALYGQDPFYENAYIELGEFYRREGLSWMAIRHYRTFLAKFPDVPAAHFLLGLNYFNTGDFVVARVQFEEAEDLAPQWPDVKYYSGLASLQMGEVDRAYREIKSAREEGFEKAPKDLIQRLEKTLHAYE